ncbi:MAG: hypothetical protein ACKOW2_04480 [Sphingobacteriaceae bacterium]
MSTQFLAPRVKKLFKDYYSDEDIFIYSCSVDPNICQISLHKNWNMLVFAWIRPDGIFIFRIPKHSVESLGVCINHADSDMQKSNILFKHSIRLSEEQIHNLTNFLVEIL